MDPVIHAQMTDLVMQEKKLEREVEEIRKDLPTWQRRVELATEKGMSQLATQAQDKVDELVGRIKKIHLEIEMIEQEKSMLRQESRRPQGHEVARAEALVEAFRQTGLVDPDKAMLDREFEELEASNTTFDFGDDS